MSSRSTPRLLRAAAWSAVTVCSSGGEVTAPRGRHHRPSCPGRLRPYLPGCLGRLSVDFDAAYYRTYQV